MRLKNGTISFLQDESHYINTNVAILSSVINPSKDNKRTRRVSDKKIIMENNIMLGVLQLL